MQDYNLFAQNVLESGRNRQLSALGAAGTFANDQQRGQMAFLLPLIQQMYGQAFTSAGLNQQPTVNEQKPWWQQALGVVGTGVGIASNAAGMFKGGGSTGDPLAGEGALTGDGPMGGSGVVGGTAPNYQVSGTMGTAPMPGWNQSQPYDEKKLADLLRMFGSVR